MSSRQKKILLSVIYWIAVLVISVGILIGLILLLESRDSSSIDGGAWIAALSSL